MNAEQWNELYPVGTLVFAYPGCRPEDSPNDTRLVTRTRTAAQLSCSGDPVVWVEGEGSYICLTHVDPVTEDAWEKVWAADKSAEPKTASAPARLSPQREAEIAARVEAASRGPWSLAYENCDCSEGCGHGLYVSRINTGAGPATELLDLPREEWELMIHAREDIDLLGSELAAVRAERDQAKARAREYGELAARRESELLNRRARIAELEAQGDRRRDRLIALQNDALNMRGSLSPNGQDRKVPFPLGETLTPAVDWLIARVAELEAERHTTNEALSDAAEQLRKNRDRIDELEDELVVERLPYRERAEQETSPARRAAWLQLAAAEESEAVRQRLLASPADDDPSTEADVT